MEIFTALIALLVLVGLALGTFNLFRKGKRRNGALLLLGASLLGGFMGALTNDPERNETTVAQSNPQPDTQEIVDPLSEEEQRRAEMVAKTAAMTESIVATVQSHYGVEAEALIPGSPFCRDDGYCFMTVGPFDVEVYGAGLAIVKTTNQASTNDYVEMCGVVFAAISGSDIMFAGQVVGETYGAALRDGRSERDVSNIEIKISPSSDGILGCQFFSY